jgi:membrane-bound lytic murein transglycosylase D
LRRFLVICLGLATLLLTACESTKEAKKTAAPAPQAVAPSMEQPVAAPPPPQQEAPRPAPQAKPDPVAAVIAEAERAFRIGQTDYKAGHLDAAKQDFNHAVDVLMQGPVAVKSDDRLQAEFDKITDEIHKLEMVAFRQGDGFTEQQSEPAPIDEANMATFPPDPNVTATAEAELRTTQSDLPLVMNEYVAGYINYFSTRGRRSFENALIRSGRYRDMIQRVLREEGVPQDLIYVAQAESGFHPLAVSRARARGMWQFMASAAVGFDLRHDWWRDDRQDPEKSTRAGARYLKELYNQFGDWYLAIAAYNSGAGNVQAAVKRTGYADFWELYRRDVLPVETKNYIPIILAMTIMSKNPAQYGLDQIRPDPPQMYDVVTVDYPVDLRLAAECVEASVEQMEDLNPSLLRGTTPRGQKFDLRVPLGTGDKYEAAIAAIPVDKRVMWRFHRVEAGDTLASIAKKYHTTEHAISQANSLETVALDRDTKLVIPVSGPVPGEGKISFSKRATRYKVHTGDTVLTVAEDFGVPPEKVRSWNRLKGNQLHHGSVLLIYKPEFAGEPTGAPSAHHKKKHSTVTKSATKPGTKTVTKKGPKKKSRAKPKPQQAQARRPGTAPGGSSR